jgi:hypothetical protein
MARAVTEALVLNIGALRSRASKLLWPISIHRAAN